MDSEEQKKKSIGVVARDLELWRAAVAIRLDNLEEQLDVNTVATQRVEANTKKIVDMMTAWDGAMKVLDAFGKVAKPVAAVITAAAGVWYFFWPRK